MKEKKNTSSDAQKEGRHQGTNESRHTSTMSVKPTFASIDEEDEIVDLSNPEVVRKYKAAAEVAHRL